jgi:2-methylcitrate dehydratase PrpD
MEPQVHLWFHFPVAAASETLASFVAQARYEKLPGDVVAKVKLHILDFLGVALAGSS